MVHENLIKNKLDAMDCSADVFCSLSGISPTRWSRALRGLAPLGGHEIESLSKIAEELAGLVNDSAPIPVSFRDPRVIKSLLEKRKRGLRLIPIPVGPAEVIGEIESEQVIAQK